MLKLEKKKTVSKNNTAFKLDQHEICYSHKNNNNNKKLLHK